MAVLIRVSTYVALVVGLAVVFVPADVLSTWGIVDLRGLSSPNFLGWPWGWVALRSPCIVS